MSRTLLELKDLVEKRGLAVLKEEEFNQLYPNVVRSVVFDEQALKEYERLGSLSFFKIIRNATYDYWWELQYRGQRLHEYNRYINFYGRVVAMEERSSPIMQDNAIYMVLHYDFFDYDLWENHKMIAPYWRFKQQVVEMLKDVKLDDVFDKRLDGVLHCHIVATLYENGRVTYKHYFALIDGIMVTRLS